MDTLIVEQKIEDCNFDVGVYTQQNDSDFPLTDEAGLSVPDINVDVAKIEAQLQRQLKLYELDPTKPFVNRAGPRVLIGFDSEFTFNPTTEENGVLSLQFHLIGDEGELPKIIYPKTTVKSARPSLQRELLTLILEALDAGVISEWPRKITIAGFFLRLDLAAFSDFAHFKTELDSAGGKVATVGQDVSFTYERTGTALPLKSTSVVRDGIGLFILQTNL